MSITLRITIVAVASGLIVGLIGLLAWGLSNKSSVTGQSGFTRVSRPAPDFTLPLFDGGELVLSEQRGKVVVINFWSSTCPPCREEARDLEDVWKAYRDSGVLFIGTNIQDFEQPARQYLDEFKVTYPNGPDDGGHISIDYGVVGIPVTFFIDKDGTVARRWVGAISRSQLTTWIDELAAGKAPSGEVEGANADDYRTLDEL